MPLTKTVEIVETECSICGKNFGESTPKTTEKAKKCEAKHALIEKQALCTHKNLHYELDDDDDLLWLKVTCSDCNKEIDDETYVYDEDIMKVITQEQLAQIYFRKNPPKDGM